MTTEVIPLGVGYYESDPMTLGKGEVDTLLLTGGQFALIHIEVQYEDGSNREDGEPQYRPYQTLRGLDPGSCVGQMYGPIVYRAVRSIQVKESGLNVLGQNA